jgi:hypothetical protein
LADPSHVLLRRIQQGPQAGQAVAQANQLARQRAAAEIRSDDFASRIDDWRAAGALEVQPDVIECVLQRLVRRRTDDGASCSNRWL